MTNLVKVERREGGVVLVQLNDPETRNAMSEQMADAFFAEIGKLRSDLDARVVVLTGSGAAFSGGGHLDMLFEKTKIEEEKNRLLMEQFYSRFLSIRELSIPVVAAINGHAVGAGLCLALGCDLRVASSAAKLGANFVHLGLHPGMGATYFLPTLLGYARAAELLYTGGIISADEAFRIGLVNRVVEPEKVLEAALAIASQIAAAGPTVMKQLKATLLSGSHSLADTLRHEAQCQALNYRSEEFLEGISAAREKRKPKF